MKALFAVAGYGRQLLREEDVCSLLGTRPRQLKKLIESGKFPRSIKTSRHGRRVWVTWEVADWYARQFQRIPASLAALEEAEGIVRSVPWEASPDPMRSYRSVDLKGVKMYTAAQIGKLFGVGAREILDLAAAGRFPLPIRVGKYKRWFEEDVQKFVSEARHKREEAYARDGKPFDGKLPAILEPFREQMAVACYGVCVYFLVAGGKVVYVGSAVRGHKRVAQHAKGTKKTAKKEFDYALFLPCTLEEVLQTERKLIMLLDPPLNKMHRLPRLDWTSIEEAVKPAAN